MNERFTAADENEFRTNIYALFFVLGISEIVRKTMNLTVGGRSVVDSLEECELVTHGNRHGDCLPGAVGGVSHGKGARRSTQGRQ